MSVVRGVSLVPLLMAAGCLLEFDEGLLAFQLACDRPGTLACYDFEDPEDVEAKLGGPPLGDDACEGGACWAVDAGVVASGEGALRLETASGSAGPPIFRMGFAEVDDPIGEGEEVYVQWRQRFNADMLYAFAGMPGFEFAGGWHQVLLTNPDPPVGEQDQCGSVQVLLGQDPRFHGPSMSHGCADIEAIEEFIEGADVLLQTGEDAQCWYNDGNPSAPPCVAYPVDEWTTYQMHVAIGTFGEPTSAVRLWIVRPGQPRQMIFDSEGLTLAGSAGEGLGKIWLGPTNWRRDPEESHAPGLTWYDELVISTHELPDP